MARILLADDDKGTLDLVRRALELDGHTVTTCDDGTDALAQLKSASIFDVLVSDVQMPGLDGVTLAGEALALHPGIRLVLMSAYAEVLDTARGLGAGSIRLLTKPFPIERVRAEVRAALGA